MTSKELREGGAESFRMAQGDSVVIQSADRDTWFNSLHVGEDGLRYFSTPGGRTWHDGRDARLAIER
eukprot:6737394-Alexandrium_andersonii.AAC.1